MRAGGFPYLETHEIRTSCPSCSVSVAPKTAPPYSNWGFLGFTGTRIRVHLDKIKWDRNCCVWVTLDFASFLSEWLYILVILSLRSWITVQRSRLSHWKLSTKFTLTRILQNCGKVEHNDRSVRFLASLEVNVRGILTMLPPNGSTRFNEIFEIALDIC